jgi:hypothetical protein
MHRQFLAVSTWGFVLAIVSCAALKSTQDPSPAVGRVSSSATSQRCTKEGSPDPVDFQMLGASDSGTGLILCMKRGGTITLSAEGCSQGATFFLRTDNSPLDSDLPVQVESGRKIDVGVKSDPSDLDRGPFDFDFSCNGSGHGVTLTGTLEVATGGNPTGGDRGEDQ